MQRNRGKCCEYECKCEFQVKEFPQLAQLPTVVPVADQRILNRCRLLESSMEHCWDGCCGLQPPAGYFGDDGYRGGEDCERDSGEDDCGEVIAWSEGRA